MKTRLQTSTKKDPAITTSRQCRGGVFLPVRKLPRTDPDATVVVTENQWGKVTLKRCRLTQTHNNIRDAILAYAELIRKAPDGRTAVLYSPGKILRKMKIRGKNHAWLYRKLEDMIGTLIEVETATFRGTGPMIQRIMESKVGMGGLLPKNETDGEKTEPRFQLVIFDPFFSYLFNVDIGVHYKDLLPAILDLRHAVNQALVRFCLSHDEVNMALEEILIALGAVRAEIPDRTKRQILKYVRDEAEAMRRDFGIGFRKMADGREGIFYQKHPKVWFESPKPLPEPDLPKKEVGKPCATTNGKFIVPEPEFPASL